VFDEAFVRVEPGQLGLVLVRGRATDKSLPPGPHFVPLMRRMQIVKYPSLEMAYRAGDPFDAGEHERSLQQAGPSLRVVLGDRATVDVGYTVRFRLMPASLKSVHERFGKDGIWSAVRDASSRAVRASLGDPAVGIADLLGDSRRLVEGRLADAVGEVLAADGFEVALFTLEDTELGRTGEVIQATVRARYELEREQAEHATRVAEVQSDAALGEYLGADGASVALRYRELGVWREIITTPAGGSAMAVAARPTVGAPPPHDEEGTGAESSAAGEL
jgi:regulator of protease activity HflC (stomatin/prohibitin superfamily)